MHVVPQVSVCVCVCLLLHLGWPHRDWGTHAPYVYLSHPHTLTHRALECGTTETSGVGDLFTGHTAHLAPSHLAFFATWYSLALQEEVCGNERGGRPFWLDSAQER